MDVSPHELARLIALRQSSGLDARNLLAPPPVEVIMPIIPPVRKKKVKLVVNHQSKHKHLLKDMQNKIRSQSKEQKDKERDEKEKMIRLRLKTVGQVESKLFPLLKNLNLHISSSESTMCNPIRAATTFQPGANNSNSTSTPTILEGTSTTSSGSTLSSSPCYTAKVSTLSQTTKQRLENEVMKMKDAYSCNQDNKSISMTKHNNYGKVPRYILERRITLAEEEQGKYTDLTYNRENSIKNNNPTWNGISGMDKVKLTDMRMPEKQRLLRELSENESKIKKELEKLPFGLQSEGSIRKRDVLYDSMKDIEKKKKIVLLTPTWGQRRRYR